MVVGGSLHAAGPRPRREMTVYVCRVLSPRQPAIGCQVLDPGSPLKLGLGRLAHEVKCVPIALTMARSSAPIKEGIWIDLFKQTRR